MNASIATVHRLGDSRMRAADDDISRLRVPPHSIEAEQALIGCVLLEAACFAEAALTVTAADFYRHEHRLIWGAVAELVHMGAPVDVISVLDQLRRTLSGESDAGGISYLNELAQCVPSSRNSNRYAEIVVERATLRSLIAASDEIATAAFNSQGSGALSLLDEAKQKFGRIAEQRALSGSRRLPLLDLHDLESISAAQSWIVKGVIPADSIGMIFGGSGTFKSFIALDLALHVAHGRPWLGRKTQQGSVLFIAAEGGSGLWKRAEAWHRHNGRKSAGLPFRVLPVAVDLRLDAWRVVEAAQAVGMAPSLVVVDTLSQTYSGEENSANEMAEYLREIGTRFRALWGCAVVLIHHTGHQETERPRGSSAIRANIDFLYGVWRDQEQMLATFECQKMKDDDQPADETFSLSVVELGTDADGDPVNALAARAVRSTEEVVEIMRQEASKGRGGHNEKLVALLHNGMDEKGLRADFYESLDGESSDTKRQAFLRALKWAKKKGLIEIADGRVLLLARNGA
jgi:KaiC/GvpD/RAD55 family RecA-like ATPase